MTRPHFGFIQTEGLEPDLFDELTRLYGMVNRHEATLTEEVIEGEITNDSGGALSVGQIIGIGASGVSLALAGGTVATGIVRAEALDGAKFVPGRFGLQYKVNLESALTVVIGTPAYLSDSVAGTVTNAAPAGVIQFLGLWATTADSNNQAEIISLITGRDIGL